MLKDYCNNVGWNRETGQGDGGRNPAPTKSYHDKITMKMQKNA